MKKYEHITKNENILNEQIEKLGELENLLKYFEEYFNEYESLLNYYYSDERSQDLQDDEQHLIPDDLPRGVLSEDGIYNFIIDYRETAIHMLEVATKMLKEQ